MRACLHVCVHVNVNKIGQINAFSLTKRFKLENAQQMTLTKYKNAFTPVKGRTMRDFMPFFKISFHHGNNKKWFVVAQSFLFISKQTKINYALSLDFIERHKKILHKHNKCISSEKFRSSCRCQVNRNNSTYNINNNKIYSIKCTVSVSPSFHTIRWWWWWWCCCCFVAWHSAMQ